MKSKTKLQSSDGRLANGILLNGVWRDYYDIIVSANELEQNSNDRIGFLTEDRDSLAIERDILLKEWRVNISSLTSVATNQLEATQIIDQIRVEKSNLERRCSSLDAQRDWLEKQRHELSKQLIAMSASIDSVSMKLNQVENELHAEKDESRCLLDLNYRRDEMIESLQKQLVKSDERAEVLGRSVVTKDRQLQALLKERNRLKDDVKEVQRELARGRKLPNHLQFCTTPHSPSTSVLSSVHHTVTTKKHQSFKSATTPNYSTDDEARTPESGEKSAACLDSPASVPGESTCDGSRESIVRNLSFTDHESQHALCAPNDVALTRAASEPNFDIRDKIYRSIIKKLQNELKVARIQNQQVVGDKSISRRPKYK